MSSLVECTDLEVTARRSRKIRLFLNLNKKPSLNNGLGLLDREKSVILLIKSKIFSFNIIVFLSKK
jgi:hypothetical protein